MTAHKPSLTPAVAGALLLAMLVLAVVTRIIGRIDPPPYAFHPVMVSP
jgi:hypothetical protein